jgi:hypothetical protein
MPPTFFGLANNQSLFTTSTMTLEEMDRHIPAFQKAAREIEAQLGAITFLTLLVEGDAWTLSIRANWKKGNDSDNRDSMKEVFRKHIPKEALSVTSIAIAPKEDNKVDAIKSFMHTTLSSKVVMDNSKINGVLVNGFILKS